MGEPSANDVARLLERIGNGDAGAVAELTPLVYDELRQLAHRALRHRGPADTIRTTALVNEAYLKLAGRPDASWEGRSHFLGVAAKAMRSILVDHARARGAAKRGGGQERIPLEDVAEGFQRQQVDVLALDEALSRLAAADARKERVVELRFFANLTIEETAAALDVTERTVERDWAFAKAWLARELDGGD